MESVSVTQLTSDTELKEIVFVDGPDGMFERLKQTFREQTHHDAPGTCWLDPRGENDDLIGDPIAISAGQAVWLLRDYFKVKSWRKIKTNLAE